MNDKKVKVTFGGDAAINLKKSKKIIAKESVYVIVKNYKKDGNPASYQQALEYFKQKPIPSKYYCHWLMQLKQLVPLLDKTADRIVLDTLHIPWQYGDENIEMEVQSFVISLVTSHNYYSGPILECLFKALNPEINDKNSENLKLNPFDISKEDLTANYKVIHLIKSIWLHVPLCQNILLKTARNSCPYFKRHVHSHIIFTYNMLLLSKLMPELRRSFLEIVISNLVKLDLNCPKKELEEDVSDEEDDDDFEDDNASEDLFPMEVETPSSTPMSLRLPSSNMSHPVGHCLDMTLCLVFRYIHFIIHGGKNFLCILDDLNRPFEVGGCLEGSVASSSRESPGGVTCSGCRCRGNNHDVSEIKNLYSDLKNAFIKIILPTHATSHVQFIMFYVLSVRPSLLSDFLDLLKNVFERPENSMEERKNAVSYLGSLLARGQFVKFSHVHYCLELLSNWCRSYLQNEVSPSNSYEDTNLHRPFYCACQTLFYSFTFNYKEYTESKTRLHLAQSLHLDEFVLSPLNPLRFCLQSTCLNFAAVTFHYQLAYCYTILENNCRVLLPVAAQDSSGVLRLQSHSLDMTFPFDPYLLKSIMKDKTVVQSKNVTEKDDVLTSQELLSVNGHTESKKTIVKSLLRSKVKSAKKRKIFETHRVGRSSLFDQLQDFLPKFKKSTSDMLSKNDDERQKFNMENVDDCDTVVEMNVLLGQDEDSSNSDTDSSSESDSEKNQKKIFHPQSLRIIKMDDDNHEKPQKRLISEVENSDISRDNLINKNSEENR